MAVALELETALRGLPGKRGRAYYLALGRVLDAYLPRIYSTYDRFLAAALVADGKQVTCRKGCSGCCRHFVDSVEPFEIVALHRTIRDNPRYPDLLVAFHRRSALFEKLRQEEGEGEEADDKALYRYFLRGASCPFLEADGACGIYASRPMVCRMFFSESAPRYCSGSAIATPWNRNFQVELPREAERALARCSQVLADLDLPEGLFPGLLAANALFGRHDGQEDA
jgi:Fe-S-cluster containining protein